MIIVQMNAYLFDPAGYIERMQASYDQLLSLSYGSITSCKLGADTTRECTFRGSANEGDFQGRMIALNRNGKSYFIMFA